MGTSAALLRPTDSFESGLTVFAVDTDKLEVTPEDSGAKFGFNLHFHTLAKASITATYKNKGD